jgi:hypothetical protein
MSTTRKEAENMMVDGFKDLTRMFMGDRTNMSLEELKKIFIGINPNFQQDLVFHDLIPTIYNIVRCENYIKAEMKK